MHFEVGRLIARIQVEGMQTFGRDLDLVGRQFGALDEKGRLASERIGRNLTYVGAAIIALVGLAVARFAQFDKAMSSASAVTEGFAEKQDQLRQAALDAGAVTVFTATESARAIAELGKAGIGATDILGGGLTGSLALAAAGQLEVADAAQIAAIAMTQFRLSGEDVPHIADLLAASANKATGGVSDMAMALKQSGLVASQAGLSIDSTIGTLTAFASAGLIGSDAGTSFRQMLLNLMTPTKQQTELMRDMKINAYDPMTGAFVGMESLAGQLQDRLGGLTQKQRDHFLGIVFGSDAIRAANVLYREGASGIRDMTAAVNDNGAATRLAAELQNNLAGDVEKLGGALDSALIQTGEGANGVLRDMVQSLTDLVDAYGDLPDGVQQAILVVGLMTGAVLLFGGMLLTTIPKIIEFRFAVQTLSTSLPALGGALRGVAAVLSGPWGIAIVAAALGLHLLQEWADSMKASTEELSAAMSTNERTAETMFATYAKGAGGITNAAVSFDRIQEAINAVDDANNPFAFFLDDDLNRVFGTLRNIGDQLGEIAKTDLSSAQQSYREFVETTDGSAESQWRLLNAFDSYKAQIIATATEAGAYNEQMSDSEKRHVLLTYAMGDTTYATEESAAAYKDIDGVMVDVTDSLDELIASLNEANGAQISASDAQIRYLDTLARVGEAIADNGRTLDINTDAGRRNRELLNDIASSAMKQAEAQLAVTHNYEEYRQTLEGARGSLIQSAIDMGASADEAARIADEILRIPSKAETDVTVIDNASGTLDGILTKMFRIGQGTNIRVNTATAQANGGVLEFYANGGFSENHRAQIASAGTTRIWNEPETGGEGYIPLAESKRGEALPVLDEIARRFGYSLVAAGGAPSGGTATSGTMKGMKIEGQLDLGGGLTGIIRGTVLEVLDGENDQRGNGIR